MAQLESRYGPSFPGDFFTSRELNARGSATLETAHDLWSMLLEEQGFDPTGDNEQPQLRSLTDSGALYFRGQSDQNHGLSTSLHRFAKSESTEDVSEELLGALEESILAEAATHGLSKNVSPGELLMILQHHAAPTRLMDVSLKPLEALYFAVEKYDAKDGRLFILTLNDQERLALGDRKDLPWTSHVRSGGKAAAEWTQSVRLIDEKPLDPRMIAQQGRFLVGGIQRAYANLNMWYDRQLRVVERQAISMLSITFPKSARSEMPATAWPAIGWTIRVPGGWKTELRSLLDEIGINHDSMYPDLTNIPWRAERAGRALLAASRPQNS